MSSHRHVPRWTCELVTASCGSAFTAQGHQACLRASSTVSLSSVLAAAHHLGAHAVLLAGWCVWPRVLHCPHSKPHTKERAIILMHRYFSTSSSTECTGLAKWVSTRRWCVGHYNGQCTSQARLLRQPGCCGAEARRPPTQCIQHVRVVRRYTNARRAWRVV